MIIDACYITPCVELPGHYRCVVHDALLPSHKFTCGVYSGLVNAQAAIMMRDNQLARITKTLETVNEALQVLAHGQHPQPDTPTPEGN